ncbi:MAG: hypothetical protein ISS70_08320 [Phycisphaerae bacterium]|nr:hypothetical protein [Phycisphaerae bacterium]
MIKHAVGYQLSRSEDVQQTQGRRWSFVVVQFHRVSNQSSKTLAAPDPDLFDLLQHPTLRFRHFSYGFPMWYFTAAVLTAGSARP